MGRDKGLRLFLCSLDGLMLVVRIDLQGISWHEVKHKSFGILEEGDGRAAKVKCFTFNPCAW